VSRAEIQPSSVKVALPREYQTKAKHRRQTLTFLTLLILVLLIGLTALGNWLQWWNLGSRNVAVPCPIQTVDDPADTFVNVVNGTARRGLAAAVAKELQHRKFMVGTTSTESEAAPINAVAYVRYGSAGRAAALTVARQFPGSIRLVRIKRSDDSVDIVIGQKYAGMVSRSQGAAAIVMKADPAGCLITKPSSPGTS
jgi:hypothetical protein